MINEATSKLKKQQICSSLCLNDVGIYLRDGPTESETGVVNLHPFQGTYCVKYINEIFYSYGCASPNKLSKFVMKENGVFLYSEYKLQGVTSKRDSFCASYC